MEMLGLMVIVLSILLFSLVSNWVKRSILTLPIIFTLFGWSLSGGGEDILNLHVIQGLVEVTLILVLFTDAARINLARLREDYLIPLRMLLFGMPLTILLGAAISQVVFPAGPWILSFLLAAILTPTDAALGQSIVNNPRVPLRIRQSINVESGLNDGIAQVNSCRNLHDHSMFYF